jgi:hypothetical protein
VFETLIWKGSAIQDPFLCSDARQFWPPRCNTGHLQSP